jgi:putative SOS response-associated peptidase YedK
MPRRYALPPPLTVEREFLPAQCWWKFEERSNVAPAQYVPVIRVHDGASEGGMMRWGLIPAWAEGEPVEEPTDVADIDTVESSISLRTAWQEGRRCILPMAGYYFWQITRYHHRQPHYVQLKDRGVFGVAAIWDRSELEKDDVIESCCIVRVAANELVEHRPSGERFMPAILRRRDYETWLKGTPTQARAVLQSYPSEWMRRHPVSPRVNSLQYDDLGLRDPV